MTKKKILGLLFFIVFAYPSHLLGQSDQIINPTGGANTAMTDGLKIVLGGNGGIHVYRQNRTQYYSGYTYPSKNNVGGVKLNFRFSKGSTYNTTPVAFVACSTTPAVQNGNDWTSSISGYAISSISGLRFYVTVNISYTYPLSYFNVDYFVRAPSGLVNDELVHLYLDHDAYILGNDSSRSYRNNDATGEFIGNYRSTTETCTGGVSPSSHGFKTKVGFRSYYSSNQSSRNTIFTNNMLQNSLSTTCVDDGVAVEFTIGPLSRGVTGAKRVLHCYGKGGAGEFNSIPVEDPIVSTRSSTPVTVDFTSASYSETVGNTTQQVSTVKINVSGGELLQDQIVNFTIDGGTAVVNIDYSFTSGFIIPAGDYNTTQTLTLDNIRITGNGTCKANGTFNMTINDSDCNDLIIKGSLSTSTFTIVYDDDTLAPGTIGSDQDICTGTTPNPIANITSPTGGTGTYTYKWERSTFNDDTWSAWTAVAGATLATYAPPVLTATTKYRRIIGTTTCVVSKYTNEVIITIQNDNPTLTSTLTPDGVCSGTDFAYTATSAHVGATFSWLRTAVAGISNAQGSGTTANIVETLINTTTAPVNVVYVITITFNKCINTQNVTVTIYPNVFAGEIEEQTICYNTTPTAIINRIPPSGGTGTYTYQWQSSSNNTSWTDICGVTDRDYTPGLLTATTYYRRIVTSGNCASGTTAAIAITVYPELVAIPVVQNQQPCVRTIPIALTGQTTGGNGTYTYQWQSSIDGLTGWSNIAGATNEMYTPPVQIKSGTFYYRRATIDLCGTIYGNVITIDLKPCGIPINQGVR